MINLNIRISFKKDTNKIYQKITGHNLDKNIEGESYTFRNELENYVLNHNLLGNVKVDAGYCNLVFLLDIRKSCHRNKLYVKIVDVIQKRRKVG